MLPNSAPKAARLAFCAGVFFASPAFSQNIFTDGTADGKWTTVGNWSDGVAPTGTTDGFILEGKTADIDTAGNAVRILYVGDARDTATTSNDGAVTMNLAPADVFTVGSLRLATDSDGAGGVAATTVNGTFTFTEGTINANNTGVVGEAVQIGSTNIAAGTLTSIVGTLNMGDGTSAPTLNYSGGRFEVGTGNGAIAVFNQNSGSVVGTNQNLIIGQGDTDSMSTMNIGGGATAATFTTGNADMNWNDGDGIVNVNSNGTITTRTVNLSNFAGNSSTFTINTGGRVNISENLNDRNGASVVNVDGGTLSFSSTIDRVRETEELNLGTGDTGSNLETVAGVDPISVLTGASSAIGGGNHNVEVLGVASTQNGTTADLFNGNVQDTWRGGTGSWSNDAGWSVGIDPSGLVNVSDQVNVVVSEQSFSVSGSPTFTATESGVASTNWSAGLRTTNNTDDAVALTALTAQDFGVLRARIETASSNVTRTGDLQIYRAAGSDAQQLDMTNGTLTVNGDVVLGGAVLGSAAQNNGSSINLTNDGGNPNLVINGNFHFGPKVFAAGDEGGIVNLDSGTMTVTGDIIETDPGVDNAQFYIDGGTLDFQGTNISAQSFRVGDTIGRTGNFTLQNGETLTNTGTFYVGNAGTGNLTVESGGTLQLGTSVISNTDGVGTLTLEAGSTMNVTTLRLGDGEVVGTSVGTGHIIATGATITSNLVESADRGNGSITLNAGTTWDATLGGDFRVASGDFTGANDASGSDWGGTGSLTMNGNSSITQAGGNFEVADFGTNRTIERRTVGTMTMNDTSLVTINNNNLIVGQQDNTDATLNINDSAVIDLRPAFINNAGQGDVNLNAGNGIINMAGGTIYAQDLNLSNNNNGAATATGVPASAVVNVSAGLVDLGGGLNYRNNGDDEVNLSGTATVDMAGDLTMNTLVASGEMNILTITGPDVTLTVGGNLLAGATSDLGFFSGSGTSSITVGGDVTLNDAVLTLDLTTLGLPRPAEIVLIDNQGVNGVNGIFIGLDEGDTAWDFGDGTTYTISYVDGDGNDVHLNFVPEPGTVLLTLLGGFGLLLRRRRK